MRSRIGCIARMSVITRWVVSSVVLVASAVLGVLAPATSVHAATTITVTTMADELTNNGECSLREAIRAANLHRSIDSCAAGSGADTIIVPAGTYGLTIRGQSEDAALTGDLDVTGQLTIRGTAAVSTLLDGALLGDRIFHVLPGANLTLENLTIQNASADEHGAGVANAGTLTSNEAPSPVT